MIGSHRDRSKQRKRKQRKRKQRSRGLNDFRTRLGIETLEPRWVLSSAPLLTPIGDQITDEGTTLQLFDIGTFSDIVEGTTTGGGSTIGLDPNDFTALPAFDPTSNVVIDTDALTVDGAAGGVIQMADVGFGAYEIAVFTFADFEIDFGITLTATGTRPLAILSHDGIRISGTIDVSATDDTSLEPLSGERFAGPGGGDGGLQNLTNTIFAGDPAAGAPAESAGNPVGTGLVGANAGGGTGGGHGGQGGRAEVRLVGSTITAGLPGAAFGDLALGIQGGSGGATAGAGASAGTGSLAGGGGGGGGIELGAVNSITVTASGMILANGGKGGSISTGVAGAGGGGGGAGGGILLHAPLVSHLGLLSATGGAAGNANHPGGGGGGGEILIAYTDSNSDFSGATEVSGGAKIPNSKGEEGAVGIVNIVQQTPPAVPVIESYEFSIDWGDGSPLVTGAATIDVPGVNIGDVVLGSFDGTHTYADDGIYTVTLSVISDTGSSTAETTGTATFTVTVNNVDPSADDAILEVVENSPVGTVVGAVSASDPAGENDPLTFAIVSGNEAGVFAIDAVTGEITVADNTFLDYETITSFLLEIEVQDDDGGSDIAAITINVLNQASIAGVVFVDVNANGVFDADEPGIDGVTVALLDAAGNPVLDENSEPILSVTSMGGLYLFEDLDPGTYRVFQQQPTGVDDGAETLGNLGGSIVANDVMELTLDRVDAFDYAFAELGQQVTAGDTAGIGFWQNKQGRELITSGGIAIADWLTSTFPNIFGNTFVGADGGDVAEFYRNEVFRQKGKKSPGPPKIDADFMAVALATFFTSNTLAGDVALAFGLNVTDTGIGTKIVNVGSNGAAFGVSNGTDLTILQLLLATNNLTDQDDAESGFVSVYDLDGDGIIDSEEATLRSLASNVYKSINEGGSI